MSAKRLVPLVVLIEQADLDRLQPVVDDLAERLAPHCGGLGWTINGWTPEMLAWSRVLACVAREDLEVHDSAGASS